MLSKKEKNNIFGMLGHQSNNNILAILAYKKIIYCFFFFYHKPLKNMNQKSRTMGKLGDLIYYRSQYDFKIKFTPGKQNLETD